MPRSVVYTRIMLCMLVGLALGAVISEASFHFLGTGETRPPHVIEIDIPRGTARLVSEGKPDPSLPSSISFVIGDTLLVRNEDVVAHELGPLFVPPGASSTMKLEADQDYSVSCSFEPSKYLGLSVESPLNVTTRLIGILEAGIPMGFLFALYGLFAFPVKRIPAA